MNSFDTCNPFGWNDRQYAAHIAHAEGVWWLGLDFVGVDLHGSEVKGGSLIIRESARSGSNMAYFGFSDYQTAPFNAQTGSSHSG